MNSALLIKLFGGLTAAAGVGTGGYFLKEHFSKSEEKASEKSVPAPAESKPNQSGQTGEGEADRTKNPVDQGSSGRPESPQNTSGKEGEKGNQETGSQTEKGPKVSGGSDGTPGASVPGAGTPGAAGGTGGVPGAGA